MAGKQQTKGTTGKFVFVLAAEGWNSQGEREPDTKAKLQALHMTMVEKERARKVPK